MILKIILIGYICENNLSVVEHNRVMQSHISQRLMHRLIIIKITVKLLRHSSIFFDVEE